MTASNDKRHLMMAFLRPTPLAQAVRLAFALGPMPALAVFVDRVDAEVTIFEVMP